MSARGRVTVSFTGSDPSFARIEKALSDWFARMRDEQSAEAPTGYAPFGTPPREGLAGPVQVSYCAQVMPAPPFAQGRLDVVVVVVAVAGVAEPVGVGVRLSGVGGERAVVRGIEHAVAVRFQCEVLVAHCFFFLF